MSIRLVNDTGKIFWFTGLNWQMVCKFASLHGWSPPRTLDPKNWDESAKLNDKYEIVGGAALSKEAAAGFAEAIVRGALDDPNAESVLKELAPSVPYIRARLPEYDPTQHATDLLKEWLRFGEFARSGALRVDLTD
jgi:hypothetical protein